MSRMLGTVSMGVRAPIIRQGDDLVEIVTNSILDAIKYDGVVPRDRDIVAMTEAIVARVQGNYVSVDNIAQDVRTKFGGDVVELTLAGLLTGEGFDDLHTGDGFADEAGKSREELLHAQGFLLHLRAEHGGGEDGQRHRCQREERHGQLHLGDHAEDGQRRRDDGVDAHGEDGAEGHAHRAHVIDGVGHQVAGGLMPEEGDRQHLQL